MFKVGDIVEYRNGACVLIGEVVDLSPNPEKVFVRYRGTERDGSPYDFTDNDYVKYLRVLTPLEIALL